jgi:hypothetical protein
MKFITNDINDMDGACWMLAGMSFGIIIGSIAMVFNISTTTPKEQPQIKPVECLTYYQWTYWSTKRDRVLNKRKRSRTDSLELRNADRILGLDETQNKYPPR